MIRILIVDDHPLYISGVAALLQVHFQDATIFQAESAIEAKTVANENSAIDWIFLDYHLPDGNGIELLKYLKRIVTRARFILTSGSDRVELVCNALDEGAHGYLSKSGSPAEVFKCLTRITAGDIYLAPDMQTQVQYYRSTVLEDKKRIGKQISKRQREVLLLLSAGYSNSEIASALGISPHTVKDHVSNIMQLLDADNRVHCITEARQFGLIS